MGSCFDPAWFFFNFLCLSALMLSSRVLPTPSTRPEEEKTTGLPTICKLPSDKGPCKDYHTRYYYNIKHHTCEKFVYGGCLGNANRFLTVGECKNGCQNSREHPTQKPSGKTTTGSVILPSVCKLPPEPGKCQAKHTRFYYNKEKQTCEKFFYTGCLGNTNRFLTADKCRQKCQKVTGIPAICQVPKDAGPCSEKISRYYYNQKSKHCEQFIYGGCGGNANHFRSSQECQKICGN